MRTKTARDTRETAREKSNRDISYRAALEGIVLLENNGALPLPVGKLALYGAGAGRTIKGGSGSGELNERRSITILEGLEAAGFTITTKSWIDDYERAYLNDEADYAEKVSKKLRRLSVKRMLEIFADPFRFPFGRKITDNDIAESDTDTCVYVVARQAGEGGDRKLDNFDNDLSEIERANIAKCARNYEKFVVVINVGSSFDAGFVDDISGIDALVYFGQQGSEGGRAFADIVLGKVSPSGKLTDSWAKRYDDIPFAREYSYLNGDLDEEYYREGLFVGYRYFDTFDVEPRYPFGYGLSYTDFDISVVNSAIETDRGRLRVNVRNTGAKFAGKETVQVYVSCPRHTTSREYQKLAAFAKTRALPPGEEQTLEIDVDLRYLAYFREKDACYVLERGNYLIRVGNSSRNTNPVAVLQLSEDIIVSRHINVCPPSKTIDELNAPLLQNEESTHGLHTLRIEPSKFETKVYDYDAPQAESDDDVEAIVEKLSCKELIDLVVGSGFMDVVLSRGYFVAPGAVGYTTSKLTDKGIINVTMGDGPAGLRLQRVSAVTKKGRIKIIDAPFSMLNYLPNFLKRLFFGNPKKHDLIHQYTTAFPTGIATAQTWNTDLVEDVGRAVGREMHEYGIVFWLAPGMNLHRNPLCGRNFEYFSEDPYLSGQLAAAITKGCQGCGGVYATLKHFVANNQEDNRNRVSSNMSERTLREMYLRGFEIAVREGDAEGVMTAYNRVNGTYASNSHDLLTKVLRSEWGFSGVVMTDWFGTGKGLADNGQCMVAGNDLIMPGGKYPKKQLRMRLSSGNITQADLKRCAANVLGAILGSKLSEEYSQNLPPRKEYV